MLKLHAPCDTNGTKFIYRDNNSGEYVLTSYTTETKVPEISLFACTGTGRVTNWHSLYREVGSHLTPRDISKVIYRYNNQEISDSSR